MGNLGEKELQEERALLDHKARKVLTAKLEALVSLVNFF